MKHTHALTAALLLPTSLTLVAACGSPPVRDQYEAYDCPAPIGKIVREDCSRSSLRWDGVQAEAKVGVGAFSAGGTYKDQAIREADDLISMLKEQRSSLCQDYNTCKLTVEQYRLDKERIEGTATAVLAIRGNVEKISGDHVTAYLEEIRKIRGGGPQPAAVAPTPSPKALPVAVVETPKPRQIEPAPPMVDVEWRPGKHMMEAVGLVADAAHKVEEKSEFGFDVDHGCLLGAAIAKGEIITIRQSMKGGLDYAILGGGSGGSLDVDIAVMDPSGKAIAADTDDDATPVVTFKAPKDGVYEIKLQLAKSSGDGAFVAMAILHKGGYSIPSAALVKSIKSAIDNAGKASAKVATLGAKGLVFHEQHNWSFYGTVLKPGEESGLRMLSLQTDPAVVLAVADSAGTNIDLYVKENESGRVVVKDDANDAEPLVMVHPDKSKRYDFSVKNAASTGTTLATVVVLDVQR